MMFMDNNANDGADHQIGNMEEYFDGRASGSMRALTETGGFGGDDGVSDGGETVKFGQSVVS